MTLQEFPRNNFADDIDLAFNAAVVDEHPSVVLRDLLRRRLPNTHLIAFANEKGGVGKSTLAFHCALSLAHDGHRVLAIDCDRRQRSLHRFLEARDGTIRTLKVNLPQPQHLVLERQSTSLLLQEIARLGHDCHFVLIDLPGYDSPVARRAIALANTVITPVNCSHADTEALGSMNPVSHQLRKAAPFAELVVALRAECIVSGREAFDWVVVKNRVRRCEKKLIATADRNLATLGRDLGFRLVNGLTERLAYRELLPFGLSHRDLKFIPEVGRARGAHSKELMRLIASLDLPQSISSRRQTAKRSGHQARVSAEAAQNYRAALCKSMKATAAAH